MDRKIAPDTNVNMEADGGADILHVAGVGKADPSIRLMEQSLIRSLDPNKEVTASGLRSIALMACLSGHDRCVDMEFMANILDDMGTLYILTRELELTDQLRSILSKVTPAKVAILDASTKDVHVQVRRVREQLRERVMLMTQCPVDGEIIS
jgi:hypothetical protein